MASVQQNNLRNRLSPNHLEFVKRFNSSERKALIAEDLMAGKSVALVLFSILAAGTIAMVFTVLATL